MKYFIHTFIIAFFLIGGEALAQTPALVFKGDGSPENGKIYVNTIRGAARGAGGTANGNFGNMGDWAVDMVVSEENGNSAAKRFGPNAGYKDNDHPLYNQGTGALTQDHDGMGALGWGSFAAGSYNRAAGVGSTAMGFNNIAGSPVGTGPGDSNFSADGAGADGNIGQTVFGRSSRATGNVSFASGFRNSALGDQSVAMGNHNYATGINTVAIGEKSWAQGAGAVAIGRETWAQGASAVAIGFKSRAAGGGSTALGQENVSWGTTNFTARYQNTAGDTAAAVGTGGSAVAMGKNNTASADASMALNRATTASNQAATSMGFGTTADNVAMLAIGVNNAAGLGNTISGGTAGSYYNTTYNGGPPAALGQPTGDVGVAFVIGNGDIDVTVNTNTGVAESTLKGANPSNAFVVKYDGSATLAGDLTVNSDARLKSNIVSLGSTLAKLMQIDGKSYTMKSNEKVNKIGLLAQEIEEVFPELVKSGMDKNKTLSVNYQGLIPVLINAIKEQQDQIEELKSLLSK